MGSEMVMVDDIPYPPEITTSKPLSLLGHGLTDIVIHFLQIKFNAIGIYLEKEIASHLGKWKGKKGAELAEDDLFFDDIVSAPVEKIFRIVVIKEIKGSQYGVQLESAVRDRLAAVDKYEEEEEEALEKVTEFFQTKYFKKDSVITIHFPAATPTAEISFVTEGKGEAKMKVENANVVEMIQRWYLGGSRAVSETTVKSLADNLGEILLLSPHIILVFNPSASLQIHQSPSTPAELEGILLTLVHMWPYFDPDYENLSQQINPPRVCIDNNSCNDCTLVTVDSLNKPGILLELVQVLSDLDLTISKAYISSDGQWFMDVFHVTDQQGRKLTDRKTMEHIEKALGPHNKIRETKEHPGRSVGMHSIGDHTAIELIGTDRPGLLSEIFAVLTSLHCNVIAAELWTHNMRVACVVYVNDEVTCLAVDDPNRLSTMEERLRNVLRGCGDDIRGAHTSFSIGSTHVDRRLHQLMFADKDYESDGGEIEGKMVMSSKPVITIDRCEEKGYSVVNIRCKDRPKLLFDIVCTLTDMQFVVFHASISSDGLIALQELYIRHKDGCTLDAKAQKEMVVKCLEAAICRRVSEGFSFEICGRDRVGLLSEVTKVLREHGLSVTRADVTTVGEQALNVFYVRDGSGNSVDMETIEALRREIGHTVMLNVKRAPSSRAKAPVPSGWAKTRFSFGGLLGKFLT